MNRIIQAPASPRPARRQDLERSEAPGAAPDKTVTKTAEYPTDWPAIAKAVKDAAGWKCEWCGHPHDPDAGYMLTVHHLDGDPANCSPENIKALCQRCHLQHQARLFRYGPEDDRQSRLW